jgi:hypothetical protein
MLLAVIDRAVVLPRRLADGIVARRTAAAIIAQLTQLAKAGHPDAEKGVNRLGSLPMDILRELAVHYKELGDAVGIRFETLASGHHFDRDAYYHAAEIAFVTGTADLADITGADCHLVGFPATETERASLTISSGGQEGRDADPRLGVADPHSRLDHVVLECSRGDTGPTLRAATIVDLEGKPDAAERVGALDEFVADGLVAHYAGLVRAFVRQGTVTGDMLMPAIPSRMLGWLRLDPDDAIGIDAGATLLLAETDLFTALERNMALPRPLPAVLTTSLLPLPIRDRRGLLKRLYRGARTGVAMAHLIVLIHLSYDSVAHRARLVGSLFDRFVRVNAELGYVHIELLRWVINELARSPVARTWPPETLLAVTWSHANELLRILLLSNVDARVIVAALNSRLYPFEERLLGRRDVREDDAHPGNVQVETYAMGCADLIARAGVAIDESDRVDLLALLMTFGDENKPTGFSLSLLLQNDALLNSMGSIFARSWADQGDDLFTGILNVTIREWRETILVGDEYTWTRLAFRYGDCESMNDLDRALVVEAAATIDQFEVDWSSLESKSRFVLVLNRFQLLAEDVKGRVRSAWEAETRRVVTITDPQTRAEAVETLMRTAVDLSDAPEPKERVEEFARRLALLRREAAPDASILDDVVMRLHARSGPAEARCFDQLVLAGRLR